MRAVVKVLVVRFASNLGGVWVPRVLCELSRADTRLLGLVDEVHGDATSDHEWP